MTRAFVSIEKEQPTGCVCSQVGAADSQVVARALLDTVGPQRNQVARDAAVVVGQAVPEPELDRVVTSHSELGFHSPARKLHRPTILRAEKELPQRIGRSSHADNVISLMNAPLKYETMK